MRQIKFHDKIDKGRGTRISRFSKAEEFVRSPSHGRRVFPSPFLTLHFVHPAKLSRGWKARRGVKTFGGIGLKPRPSSGERLTASNETSWQDGGKAFSCEGEFNQCFWRSGIASVRPIKSQEIYILVSLFRFLILSLSLSFSLLFSHIFLNSCPLRR